MVTRHCTISYKSTGRHSAAYKRRHSVRIFYSGQKPTHNCFTDSNWLKESELSAKILSMQTVTRTHTHRRTTRRHNVMVTPQHTFSEMYLSQTNTVINSNSRPTTTLCRENFIWGSQLGQFRQGRAISAFPYGELDPVTGRLNLLEYWFFGRFCCSKFTQWVERRRSRLQLRVNTVCTNTAWHITTWRFTTRDRWIMRKNFANYAQRF